MHIGGGRNAISKKWHRNGRPRPTDLHGGGENLRAKDLPSVHHAAEKYLTAMVLDGVFERFPDLRCGVIEMGASWLPSLMVRIDDAARSFKRTEPMLGELSMKPSDYLRRQVRVTPFPGEDVAELVKISSPELYLFSSDYPHPEGAKDPIGHFERSFDEQDIDQKARDAFYEGNYKTLMGVQVGLSFSKSSPTATRLRKQYAWYSTPDWWPSSAQGSRPREAQFDAGFHFSRSSTP